MKEETRMVRISNISQKPTQANLLYLQKYFYGIKMFFLAACLLLFLKSPTLAQEPVEKTEGGPVEPLKIAYITKKLNLSTEEAQKFWPIYNDYMKEIRQARQESKGEPEILTEEKILNIRKKYNIQFANALPAPKVNQFFHSEKEFNNFVRKELIERNQQRLQQQRMQQQRPQQPRKPLKK